MRIYEDGGCRAMLFFVRGSSSEFEVRGSRFEVRGVSVVI